MKRDVVLIVRARGHQAVTTACLQSIRAHTHDDPWHTLVLVDDGSDPPLVAPECDVVLRHETSLGAVSATNTGLTWARTETDAPYLAILDNDVRVPAGDYGWLQRWVAALEAEPGCGAMAATLDVAAGPQHILRAPVTYTADWTGEEGRSGHKTRPAVPAFVSAAVLLRRDAVEAVGLWDEQFNPGNWEDTDYALQLRVQGWTVKVATSVFLHHAGHQTFGEDLGRLLEVNGQKMLDKWGPGRLWDLSILSRAQLRRLVG